jgi:hypothetical protein
MSWQCDGKRAGVLNTCTNPYANKALAYRKRNMVQEWKEGCFETHNDVGVKPKDNLRVAIQYCDPSASMKHGLQC